MYQLWHINYSILHCIPYAYFFRLTSSQAHLNMEEHIIVSFDEALEYPKDIPFSACNNKKTKFPK